VCRRMGKARAKGEGLIGGKRTADRNVVVVVTSTLQPSCASSMKDLDRVRHYYFRYIVYVGLTSMEKNAELHAIQLIR
jgi:hypothetical protein